MIYVSDVLGLIKFLISEIEGKSRFQRIQAYTSVIVLLRELQSNLDPRYIHHNYTRENIGRILSMLYDLWASEESQTLSEEQKTNGYGRINSCIILLDDPTQWPSICFIKVNGENVEGTNNPQN